jgi:hypothetical protein
MSLEKKIIEDLKEATKKGDKLRMETLRSIRASIIEFNKSGLGREMNEEDEIKILQNLAKKRKDSIEMFEKGNRFDLADREKSELEIIKSYLPQELSEDDIRHIVKKIIVESGAKDLKDLGRVMSIAMKEMKGRADGQIVQNIVRSLLG